VLIFYFFFSTLVGLISTGIRFLWVKLYTIKRKSTPVQALVLATIILMLSLVALNYTVTDVLTPQYARFGNQKYVSLYSFQ
jgi:LMBR1 domain-containing protein 1